jgi:poly-gamma-glutamate synthesis protein (capsule biosynthesis protein)
VGSHPHAVQPAELLRDGSGRITGITAYSLGNMVSNQRRRRSDGGILLRAEITRGAGGTFSVSAGYIPLWVRLQQNAAGISYWIVPHAADTLPAASLAEKQAYDLFFSDTREVMGGDTAIHETTVP